MTVDSVAEDWPKIIYIMGTGRSGSTILEVLLGNSPGVHQAGEVTHIYKDGLVRGRRCACGVGVSECSVWGPVLKDITTAVASGETLQLASERIENHSRFLRTLARRHTEDLPEEYIRSNAILFEGLAERSGCRWVVDSSKYAGRALALKRAFPNRVKIIAISRSPEGLLSSFAKKNQAEQLPKSSAEVIAYDTWVTLCCRIVTLLYPRDVIRIRYEDLLRDPKTQLKRLEELLELDLTKSINKVENSLSLVVGHIVTGNRLRYSDLVKFRVGQPSLTSLRLTQRLASGSMKLVRRMLAWS